MTTFPNSPRLQKGAIVGLDPLNPMASVIIFQYNPETLTRTITAQTTGGEIDKGEALRIKGPPQETIKIDIEIDATDQLEKSNTQATTKGIHPTLASLEMLLYPKSRHILTNEILSRTAGILEIIPPEAPLILFAWGDKRVLPVRLTELSITEEAFDPNLNPIRAKVSLGMRVLTYNDLGLQHPGGLLFMAHQILKETMATLGSAENIPPLPSI